MAESMFRQLAREAMALSADTKVKERDVFAHLAYVWALAALLDERLERAAGTESAATELPQSENLAWA
jgi:hypothetical protein